MANRKPIITANGSLAEISASDSLILPGVAANAALIGPASGAAGNATLRPIDRRDVPSNMAQCQFWCDDWLNNTNAGETGWTATVSGTGAAATIQPAGVAGHCGIVRIGCGTTATGRTALHKGGGGLCFTNALIEFEADIRIVTLADATNDYQLWIGFGNQTGAGDHANGIYFFYDRLVAATWQAVTATASTRTTTSTATTVAAATWIKLKVVVDKDANSAQFYINGTLVATNTTNIPPGDATNTVGLVQKIIKRAGTTDRQFDLDYVSFRVTFNTSR